MRAHTFILNALFALSGALGYGAGMVGFQLVVVGVTTAFAVPAMIITFGVMRVGRRTMSMRVLKSICEDRTPEEARAFYDKLPTPRGHVVDIVGYDIPFTLMVMYFGGVVVGPVYLVTMLTLHMYTHDLRALITRIAHGGE